MPTLTDLIGVYDNLGETQPVLNKRSTILGIGITFLILSWLCALFRFYTRFFVMKSPWWDDLFVMLSMASVSVGGAATYIMTEEGMGQHFILLSDAQIAGYLRAFWIANGTYPTSTALIKLALLLQFLRIYERRTRIWFINVGIIVFTALWGLSFGIIAWVPTVPINAYWNLTMPATRYAYGSLDAGVFVATYEAHAVINMVLDAVVLAVAVPLFFRPGIRRNSYWGLLSLFIIGGCVNIMSVWRLQSIVENRATTSPTFDPTWYGPTPIILSSLEIYLSAICASLPVFWPVIKKTLGPYIMVTHEVQIVRESRYGPGTGRPGVRAAEGGTDDDDNVELRQQSWGSEHGSGVIRLEDVQANEGYDKSGHYRDSFTKQQVLGQETVLGRITSVRVRCDSRGDKNKELEIKL